MLHALTRHKATTIGPILAKLTSFWNMSEATNTTRADSLGLNPLAVTRGTVPAGVGPKGGGDVAASFSVDKLSAGANASTRINVSNQANGGSHCLFGWIYQAATQAALPISVWDASDSFHLQYMLALSAGNSIFYNGGSAYYAATVAMGTGWHFFVAWRDNADGLVRISIDNGTPSVSASASTPTSNAINLIFGGSDYGGDPTYQEFTGLLSRVGWIKGDILTSTEITELYNGGPSGAMSYADIVAAGI